MPVLAPSNIRLSDANWKKLNDHISGKLAFGKDFRDSFTSRLQDVDVELSGYVKLDRQDRQRDRDNRTGKGPKPTDINSQIAAIQLDELVTFFLELISTEGRLYKALAPKEKQEVARGFSALFNKHAKEFKHYSAYARFYAHLGRYNFGGMLIDWCKEYGQAPDVTTDGRVTFKQGIVRQGNKLINCDPYNTIWDTSVPIYELPERGEFVAMVDMYTPFRVHKMIKDKEITDVNEFSSKLGAGVSTDYYFQKPTTRDYSGLEAGGNTSSENWVSIMSGGKFYDGTQAVEMVDFYGWLEPKSFGLGEESDLQVWRCTLVPGVGIVSAQRIKHEHGRLPFAFAVLIDDELGLDTRSWGEILLPMQRTFGHRMNTYQKGLRKSLERSIVYDPRVFPAFKNADTVASRIPAASEWQRDKPLNYYFAVVDNSDMVPGAFQEMDELLQLMQRFLPTNIAQSVVDLQRATMYQAATLIQSSSRKNHKMAKVVDDMAGHQIRTQMFYNTIQYGESVDILDERGQTLSVNPAQFVQSNVQFDISDGLKGVDKLLLVESMRDVINMMLQSRVANEQIDVVQIIDYWMSLLGDATDFTAFRYQSPFDALGIQEKQIAFQLLQQFIQQQGGKPSETAQRIAGPVPSVAPGASATAAGNGGLPGGPGPGT